MIRDPISDHSGIIPSQTIMNSESPETFSRPIPDFYSDGNRTASLSSSPTRPLHGLPELPIFKSPDQTSVSRTTNGKADTAVAEAADNVISALTKVVNSNQRKQNQQTDEGIELADSNSGLCNRKRELLLKILGTAYHRLSDPESAQSSPRIADLQSETGKEEGFKCRYCSKRTRLRCEIKYINPSSWQSSLRYLHSIGNTKNVMNDHTDAPLISATKPSAARPIGNGTSTRSTTTSTAGVVPYKTRINQNYHVPANSAARISTCNTSESNTRSKARKSCKPP